MNGYGDVMLAALRRRQADQLWSLALLEVTFDGFTDVFTKFVQRIGFGKDGMADGTSCQPALGCFFDSEQDLGHDSSFIWGFNRLPLSQPHQPNSDWIFSTTTLARKKTDEHPGGKLGR